MKIEIIFGILMIGVILFSGCSNNTCEFLNGDNFYWKLGWDGGCKKIEINETEEEFKHIVIEVPADYLERNNGLVRLKWASIDEVELLDGFYIKCYNLNNDIEISCPCLTMGCD